MNPRPVEETRNEIYIRLNPKSFAYAEAVLAFAAKQKFRVRTGGDVCLMAEAYDASRVEGQPADPMAKVTT